MARSPGADARADVPDQPSMFAPFAVRDFRLLFAGFTLGQAVMPLQFVTGIFWVQQHADPAVVLILVGVIGTMRGTGMLTFGLFGGALADRFDRRKLLMLTQAGALSLNLGIAVVMWLMPGGAGGLSAFFVLTFLAAAMFAVDGPTRNAMVPEILGPRLTAGGIALNTAAMQLAMPISIFAVGILVDQLGFAATYALSTVGHLIEIAALLMMTYRSGFAPRAALGLRDTARDVGQGMSYVRGHPTVLWIILLLVAMMAISFPPTANLGPTWVTTVVGASFSEFGFIALGWGGGAFVASVFLTRYSQIERKGLLIAGGAVLFTASFVVFGNGTTWPYAVVGNIGLGIGLTMAMVSATALIANLTPNAVRGRVMSLLMLNMGVAQALTLPVAVVAQEVSLQTLFPVLSFIGLGTVVVILATHPRIWRARVSPNPELEAAAPSVGPTPAAAADSDPPVAEPVTAWRWDPTAPRPVASDRRRSPTGWRLTGRAADLAVAGLLGAALALAAALSARNGRTDPRRAARQSAWRRGARALRSGLVDWLDPLPSARPRPRRKRRR